MPSPGDIQPQSYNERAAAADRKYAASYESAVAAMPARIKTKLIARGLDKPMVEEYHAPNRSEEVEEERGLIEAITNFDPAAIDSLGDILPEMFPVTFPSAEAVQSMFGVDEATAKAILLWHRQSFASSIRIAARKIADWHIKELRQAGEKLQALIFNRIVGGFMRRGNVRVRAMGLAIAAGLDALNGVSSQAEAAEAIGVTPAAISNAVNYWADILELPRNRFTKDQSARDSYSTARKTNHWRNQKYKQPT